MLPDAEPFAPLAVEPLDPDAPDDPLADVPAEPVDEPVEPDPVAPDPVAPEPDAPEPLAPEPDEPTEAEPLPDIELLPILLRTYCADSLPRVPVVPVADDPDVLPEALALHRRARDIP